MLDDKDDQAVDLFNSLGMPKNLAKTLIYISQVDECRSADIEHTVDLRQPEVSVAMQEFERRGWTKKRNMKKKGKGRPVHLYSLTKSLPEIVKILETEKLQEFETVEKNFTELKGIISTR